MINFFKSKKKSKIYKIRGMHCASCAMIIESDLEDNGFSAKCSYAKGLVEVTDTGDLNEKRIREVILKSGYDITS